MFIETATNLMNVTFHNETGHVVVVVVVESSQAPEDDSQQR